MAFFRVHEDAQARRHDDEPPEQPPAVLEPLRQAHAQSQGDPTGEPGPFQEALAADQSQNPAEQKRGVGECHAGEGDVKARKRHECRGSRAGPCPGCPSCQPGRRRDRQCPGQDRDQNRREVADAQPKIGDAHQDRKTGRSVGNQCRIQACQAPGRDRPEPGDGVDALVEM